MRHRLLLPNIRVYRNPLNNNLVLAGDMGVQEDLVDDDYPTLDMQRCMEKNEI